MEEAFELFQRHPQLVPVLIHLLFGVGLFVGPLRQESLYFISGVFAYLFFGVGAILLVDVLKRLLEVRSLLEELISLVLRLCQLLVQFFLEGRHNWLLRTFFFPNFCLLCGDARKHVLFELILFPRIFLLFNNLLQLFLFAFLVLDRQFSQVLLRLVECGLHVRYFGRSLRVPYRTPKLL